jgi:Tol biopolymer transport system component/tRNA A-37 threonylcarbamoyl transferase component Bud32
MTLTAGTKLGPYEILSPLGAGGMGEVYRARDTKLGREVAVKTLPDEFTRDPERLARFEREAKVLASLNHPNIAAIYGLEESGGTRVLVLELVPGETISEKLAAGPMPAEEAFAICRQIAEALESAHESGIIHRDLKPANVKVTPAGKVKVLDFGLAKAFSAEPVTGRDISHSPTVTSGGTKQGVILGTAAYMSPEQARGKPVDRRTDIWSFGCVLYEMLAGRKAFEGETVSDVMVSVLTREPDWKALPAGVPQRLRELLRRCLQKDPQRRLHDIADARLEIEDAATDPAPVFQAAAPSVRSGGRFAALAVTALVSAAIAALLVWRLPGRAPAGGPPRATRLARITHTSLSQWPAWSPDGSLLAYASDRSGNFEIYVRRGEAGQDVNVTNDPAQDIQPAFSPDGNTIAFISTRASRTGLIKIGGTLVRSARTYGGDLWVAPALGGGARRLAPDANFPTWRPDGKGILYVSGPENRRELFEVSPDGGPPRRIVSNGTSILEIDRIACSPDGRWISVETQLEGLFLMPASGGRLHPLLNAFSHSWDGSSRRLYYVAFDAQGGSRVQFARIDPGRGAVQGDPQTVSLMTSSLADLAVSRDGLKIAVAEEAGFRNLTRLPLAAGGGAPAGPEEALSTGRVSDGYPSVSPDGKRVAYVSDILGHSELWVLDLDSGRRDRVPLPGEDLGEISPVWLPDGRRLLFSRLLANNVGSNWIVSLDGSGAEEVLSRVAREGFSGTLSASPDGRKALYPKSVAGVEQIFLVDIASRQSVQITDTPGSKFDMVWSPDGRSVAVTALHDGVMQLFRMPASGGPMQQLTTGFERMRHPFFSPDGRWIYIQPSHRNIWRVRAEGGPLEQVTRFPEGGLFLEEPTISPDGRYLYYCRGNGGSSLWLMTLEGENRRP